MKKLFLILLLFIRCSEPIKIESIVIDKVYVPSRSGIGTGISSKGTVVTTFQNEYEKYLIFCKEEGEIINFSVHTNTYFMLNKGDKILYWNKWSGRSFIKKID